MSFASSYVGFLIPMTIMAAAQPFYAVGSDSMMADLIAPERRTTGYSILRMANNAGISVGPAIGGFIVSRSYLLAGLPEYLYSWLPITNALMCVFVQYPVTRITRRFRPLPVVAVGMLI